MQSHYIPKFIIKNFGNEENKVFTLSYKENGSFSFGTKSVKNLQKTYTKKGLFNKEEELFFSQYEETLKKIIDQFEKNKKLTREQGITLNKTINLMNNRKKTHREVISQPFNLSQSKDDLIVRLFFTEKEFGYLDNSFLSVHEYNMGSELGKSDENFVINMKFESAIIQCLSPRTVLIVCKKNGKIDKESRNNIRYVKERLFLKQMSYIKSEKNFTDKLFVFSNYQEREQFHCEYIKWISLATGHEYQAQSQSGK